MVKQQQNSKDGKITKIKEYYEVESIAGKKQEKGQVFYFVKWKNFNSYQNTWEPKKNVEHLKQFVEEFEKMDLTKKLLKKEELINDKDFNEKIEEKVQKVEVVVFQQENKIREIGSFHKKDTVEKIISAKVINKRHRKIEFHVQWKKRSNNVKPLDSIVSNQEMLKFEEDKLIDFYETHLQVS